MVKCFLSGEEMEREKKMQFVRLWGN